MATGVHLWSQTAGTNASADTSINWAEGQAPSSINDSARALMARVADFYKDLGGLTTAGSSTAFTVTSNRAFASAAVMAGSIIVIIPHATSGATPTLAVDGLTARQIRSATGTNIATGALIAGTPYAVLYVHASTEFILLGYTETFANVTATGTLAVTGAATLSSTLAVTGNLSVNTNKFTVAAASGNTVIAGTLNVTGAITASFTAPTVQRFTATGAGTYTPTAGMVRIRVRMFGAGGGGSAAVTNSGGNATGTTSFESWTAVGGAGGALTVGGAGGSGGATGAGTLIVRVAGGGGAAGGTSATAGVAIPGGMGGGTALSGGGKPGTSPAANSGGGGGGGGGVSATNSGGGGGAGEMVEFWMTAAQVGASVATSIGVGGTAGAAGTSAGAAGGNAQIIVDEFYS